MQPVFQGGRLRADVERERAILDQRRAEYARTVQVAFREVLDGLQGQSSLRSVESAREAQVKALRRATDLAELQHKEGEIAYLELLDVRRALFAAEIELLAARREALSNTVDLALALGGGPSEALPLLELARRGAVPASLQREALRLSIEAAFSAGRCEQVKALADEARGVSGPLGARAHDWVERCEALQSRPTAPPTKTP